MGWPHLFILVKLRCRWPRCFVAVSIIPNQSRRKSKLKLWHVAITMVANSSAQLKSLNKTLGGLEKATQLQCVMKHFKSLNNLQPIIKCADMVHRIDCDMPRSKTELDSYSNSVFFSSVNLSKHIQLSQVMKKKCYQNAYEQLYFPISF